MRGNYITVLSKVILTCIANDTLSGRFLTPIENPEHLAQEMDKICPDIVSQVCGSVARLVDSLRTE